MRRAALEHGHAQIQARQTLRAGRVDVFVMSPPNDLKNPNRNQWDEKMNLKVQELAWGIVTQYPPSGVAAGGRVTISL